MEDLEKAGMKFVGHSTDNTRMEILELPRQSMIGGREIGGGGGGGGGLVGKGLLFAVVEFETSGVEQLNNGQSFICDRIWENQSSLRAYHYQN